jgi:hypothetical protein
MSRATTATCSGFVLLGALLGAACTGPAGETGPHGSQGVPGLACWDLNQNGLCDVATEDLNQDGVCDSLDCHIEQGGSGGTGGLGGTGGTGGMGGSEPETPYVGMDVCNLCHEDNITEHSLSGHAYALSPTDGTSAPSRPYDSFTGGVHDPPLFTPWSDVSYVVGGFAWRALYVQTDGYLLTGPNAGDDTQWNFGNPEVGTAAGWASYHGGEQVPFDCGSCHATGWIPCAVGDPSCQHQDAMPGMAGSFYGPGVQCEACHGPGKDHASSPYYVKPTVDRSAEACGRCHGVDDPERIQAADGFISSQQQYNQLFAGKKRIMRCIDCHDPHQSITFSDPDINPNGGFRTPCLNCHIGFDSNQKSLDMMIAPVECTDCHMPPMAKSAVGDLASFTADLPGHVFVINPDQSAPQFYTDGGQEYSEPYITLDYACHHCHGNGASDKTLDELEAMATGYHQ